MGPDHTPMLRAKLRFPELPSYFIHRRRLHDLLDGVVTKPLSIVVAPAGSGKTLLVSGWIADCQLPVAWLSLDDTNSDPSQFWFEFMVALEQVAPGSTLQASAALSHGLPITDVVAQLLDGLDSATPNECVLVVDDMHLVDDAVVSERDADTGVRTPRPRRRGGHS